MNTLITHIDNPHEPPLHPPEFPRPVQTPGPTLAAQGHTVVALTLQKINASEWQGVKLIPYAVHRGSTPNVHPWVSDFETKTIRGEACFRAALRLKAQGFTPAVIIAHPGWGESLFLKDVWPHTQLIAYCEFFYHREGADVGFDPEFPVTDPGEVCRLRLKNLNHLLHFDVADVGLSPTRWPASTFPEPFRHRIRVIHDGIDTRQVIPNPQARLRLEQYGLELSAGEEIITFVNRNLEPMRGAHSFLRALPDIQRRSPKARVLIVGGDEVSYGKPLPDSLSYRQKYLNELDGQLDLTRIHFLGKIPYPQFLTLLHISAVHVYLTYPFVLSWSMLEAMSAGCLVVGSRTAPVEEVITHGDNGLLVDFFNPQELADAVDDVLNHPDRMQTIRTRARQTIIEHYDLHTICLPAQLALIEAVAQRPSPPVLPLALPPVRQPLPTDSPAPMTHTFLHVGCGPKRKAQTTRSFNCDNWQELRLDIDASVEPDVVGAMLDLSAVASGSVSAIFSSHNIEHLYPHEVPTALAEFRRVLTPDGFVVITCPDLQSVCALIAEDKLTEPAYTSPAGPIAPLDILYGHRAALARGNLYMAHRCGFTARVLVGTLQAHGFASIVSQRRGPPYYDLWALATLAPADEPTLRTLSEMHFPAA